MSTRSHPKRGHFVDIFVNEMSPKVSMKCHLFCPRDVTYYVHDMSATVTVMAPNPLPLKNQVASCMTEYLAGQAAFCLMPLAKLREKGNKSRCYVLHLNFQVPLLIQHPLGHSHYRRWSVKPPTSIFIA